VRCGWVDRNDGHANPIVLIEARRRMSSSGQRGFAGAAGAGIPKNGVLDAGGGLQQRLTDAHRVTPDFSTAVMTRPGSRRLPERSASSASASAARAHSDS